MNMRRNVISLLIWFTVIAIFVAHIILTKRNRGMKANKGRGLYEMKETKSIELKGLDIINHNFNNNGIKEKSSNKDEQDVKFTEVVHSNVNKGSWKSYNLSEKQLKENKNLKSQVISLQKENHDLRFSKNALLVKEKQLKNLVRRLAAKLKGKEGGLLPKLDPSLPWVFAVTPTYSRFTQKADLIRLSQTLLHVTNLHWILVEDSSYRTDLVSKLLIESGLSFTHLNIETPSHMKRKSGEKYNKHHRGVVQRNLALKWIRDNVNTEKTPGVVYFMDDDNTYHRKIFDEMRWAHHIAVWPVALTGGLRFSGPICDNGNVVGFRTNWAPDRSFPIDMSGFAVNLKLLIEDKPEVTFDSTAKRGYLEPTFLERLTTMEQLEPMANNCTKVLVWHTRTESPKASLKGEKEMIRQGRPSDPSIET